MSGPYKIFDRVVPDLRDYGMVAVAPDGSPLAVALPDGSGVQMIGSMMKKWVDDFGGTALDTTLWEVVTNTGGHTMTVANSVLSVVMSTTANAELALLSRETFTIPFDLYFVAQLSQRLAENNVLIELVEVNPATGAVIPHATLPGEVRNRGSVRFGGSTSVGHTQLEGTCDDSGLVNNVNNTSQQGTTGVFDGALEVRPVDMIYTSMASDSAGQRNNAALRLSRQVPDPNGLYKIRLRFLNGATPPATPTTVSLLRLLVCDVQELQAEISSGRGDTVAGKAMAVNLVSSLTLTTAQNATTGVASGTTAHSLPSSAASVNNTTVKASAGKLVGGMAINLGAATRFLKIYNKASSPAQASDTPAFIVPLPPNVPVYLSNVLPPMGHSFSAGIAYAITGGIANTDATAVAAGEVSLSMTFV